mmetsp:Transcript_26708/g.31076  ORF Transcript_26708/g.31076 Transcript_26708/m.31076 type:complete len:342 (-) Transcript_26708:1539-2564(-)
MLYVAARDYGTTFLAPEERELNVRTKSNVVDDGNDDDEDKNSLVYEWIKVELNHPFAICQSNKTGVEFDIRSVKSSISLMESHVGEEVWDAAKLFCSHYLCNMREEVRKTTAADVDYESTLDEVLRPSFKVKGQRVLELGSGCGLLGIVTSFMGASEVLCTDYLPEVMNNLAFNLMRCSKDLNFLQDDCQHAIRCAVLDWRDFAANDLLEIEWMIHKCGNQHNSMGEEEDQDSIYYSKEPSCYMADIIVGSALIYSAEGAAYCSDTIHHFFSKQNTKEAIILQMPGRPGFDRFLRRLEFWGINYQAHNISETVFDYASVTFGRIATDREAFKMYHICPQNK